MLEMLGVAIEHFGTLPENLPFTPGQWTKIIAWSRIQSHAMDVCKQCSDKQDDRMRECFFCGRDFRRSDRRPHGRSHGPQPARDVDMDDAISRALGGKTMTRAHELKKERIKEAATDDDEAELKEKQRADAKAAFLKTLAQGD